MRVRCGVGSPEETALRLGILSHNVSAKRLKQHFKLIENDLILASLLPQSRKSCEIPTQIDEYLSENCNILFLGWTFVQNWVEFPKAVQES